MGGKSSFIELKKQRGVHVIPCEKQPSNLFPLAEKESNQGSRLDMKEHEIEEERQAKVKRSPVLPSKKEKNTRPCRRFAVVKRAWQVVPRKILTNVQRMNHRCRRWPWTTDSLVVTRTLIWPQSWCLFRKGPEPYAIHCVPAFLDIWGQVKCCSKQTTSPPFRRSLMLFGSSVMKGQWWRKSEAIASIKWCGREWCAKNRESHEDLRLCAAREARLQS